MDIQDFLLARIAEDEAVVAYPDEHERDGGYNYAEVGGNNPIPTVGTDRVLRECAAKRAIVGGHERYGGSGEGSCATCTNWLDEHMYDRPPNVAWPCPTIVALAAIYADHPDYQQEWSA